METKTVKQTVTFKAQRHEVYEALMDSKKHAKFTGDKATISRKVGGKFSVFDGYGEGTNIELIPDSKIVQNWRAGDCRANRFHGQTSRQSSQPKTWSPMSGRSSMGIEPFNSIVK